MMNFNELDAWLEEESTCINLYLSVLVEVEVYNIRTRMKGEERIRKWMDFAKNHGTVLVTKDPLQFKPLIVMGRSNYDRTDLMKIQTRYQQYNELVPNICI